MSIDLGSKPEGATHINPHNGLWIKYLGGGGGHYQFFKDGQWEMGFGCMSNSYLEIEKPKPWTGEGVPPAGTVCEYRADGWPKDQWEIRTVMYVSDYHVITKEEDGTERRVAGEKANFRPIRTDEQVAADNRIVEINEMLRHIRDWPSGSHGVNHLSQLKIHEDVCCDLYDAGYRKQVQP